MDKAELLAEAYRRGLLDGPRKAAFEEAQRRGLIGKQATGASPAATTLPSARQMKGLAYGPAYEKGRQRQEKYRANDKRAADAGGPLGRFGAAAGDWTTQVARNTGANDEIAGATNFLLQGVENLGRSALGKPIEVPARVAGRAAMDDDREQRSVFARAHPVANAFATAATIATTARPSGGAMLRNPLAAGAAATAQNLPFALARQEGGLKERLPGAAKESALTFGLGAGLTAGANAFQTASRAAAARPPSDARLLSQQGVTLTPGQMLGGVAQRAEDAATSTPILGDAIRSARIRGLESFDRIAIDRSLAPIGHGLAPDASVGREGVQAATAAISDAYETALRPVVLAPDAQFATDVAGIAGGRRLPAGMADDLAAIVDDVQTRTAGQISGRDWKQIDSELASMVRAADNASSQQPAQRFLRDAIQRLRVAHQGLLERADPAAFGAVRQADEATANLVRIREASQGAATSARGGVFSPADLNRAVRAGDSSAGNRQFAAGEALMQDLTDPAMRVLPQTVPDSGTPFRSLMTMGGLSGGGVALGVEPATVATAAGLTTAGAALYSRPVQNMINAVYRAKTPGQARGALAVLARAAARDPALIPVYEDAARQLGLAPGSSGGRPARQQPLQAPTTP